jgi:hypothetical protein
MMNRKGCGRRGLDLILDTVPAFAWRTLEENYGKLLMIFGIAAEI